MSFEIVDKLNRDFENSYNNGQMKEAVSSYANDARLFATNKQIYQGLNQIEKYYSDTKDQGNTKVKLNTGQIIQSGPDYLIEISTYQINTDGGNFLVVWKKDGQQWKKIIDIFN